MASASPDEDAADVARALAGTPEAFRPLVERHQRVVLALVGALLPRREDREDAAQEAFVAAWEHLDSFDASRGTFAAWVLRIARNRALNRRRRPRHEPADPASEPAAPAPAPPCTPDDRIDAAVASLPPEQRTAFVLAVVHGLPLEEVARVEDVPVGTVKSRLSRAKERLRARLQALREALP